MVLGPQKEQYQIETFQHKVQALARVPEGHDVCPLALSQWGRSHCFPPRVSVGPSQGPL